MEVIYATPKIGQFIKKLDPHLAERVLNTIDLIELYGHTLQMPHTKPIGNGLHELRLTGGYHVRILYSMQAGTAYMLHIFEKKTSAIPRRDIAYALRVKNLLA